MRPIIRGVIVIVVGLYLLSLIHPPIKSDSLFCKTGMDKTSMAKCNKE